MELKIEKLSDIVAWADGKIRDGGYYEEKYKNDALSAYCCVKVYELWKIRDVVLKGIERHSVYTNALNKDIADKAAKIDLLEKEIEGRKAGYMALKELLDTKYISIDEHNDICKKHEDTIEDYEEEIKSLNDEIERRKEGYNKDADMFMELKEEVKKLNKCVMEKNNTINTANDSIVNLRKEVGVHEEENKRLSEKILSLKDELKAMTQSRDIWFDTAGRHGDTIRRDSKEIEKLKVDLIHERDKNEKLAKDHAELENDMRRVSTMLFDKNGRIAQLEEQVKNLEKEIEELKKELDICGHEVRFYKDRMNTLYEEKMEKEEDHGRKGFKEYIKYLVKEEERKFEESWKVRLNEELAEIFEEEEETVKYKPSEIDRFTDFLKDEVDKKRIVDIGEGVEKNLGVSRELFDAAIKTLVDDGYQEIIGRIPQATNSYVLIDMHVLATPDVETKETANAENIKSLDFGIPCGEDAIE